MDIYHRAQMTKCPKQRSCVQRFFVAICNALGSPYFNWSVRFQGRISDGPVRWTGRGDPYVNQTLVLETLKGEDTEEQETEARGGEKGLREVLVWRPAFLLTCQLTAGMEQDSDVISVCSGSRDHAVSAAVELSLCLYLFRKEILHIF